MKHNEGRERILCFDPPSAARVWPDNQIMSACDERGFLDAVAADGGLAPPALPVKQSALPADNAALVRNSCPGEPARCCLTVAGVLRGDVGYYLAGNESARWARTLRARNGVWCCV